MRGKQWGFIGGGLALVAVLVAILFVERDVNSQQQRANQSRDSVPTFYLHGYSGSHRSTDSMIKAAREQQNATQVLTAVVSPSGQVTLRGRWVAHMARPIVQVVFQDSRNTHYQQDARWFKNVLVAVNRQHSFKHFNVVAHSMGNMAVAYYLLNYATDTKLPRMAKVVALAGHYDGILGMDDQANRNQLQANGQPQEMTATYRQLLALRTELPKGELQFLNIYGDLDDGTHSDGRVSNVSSRSLRYLVAPRAKQYREQRFVGPNAQHSRLHENAAVNSAVLHFLW